MPIQIMTADKTKISLGRSAACAAAILGAVLTVGTSTSAQQTTQPQQPQLVDKGKHGDWTIRCTQPQAAQTPTADNNTGKSDLQPAPTTDDTTTADTQPAAAPRCVMIQIARHPTQQNFGLSVLVVKQTVQEKTVTQLRITAPLGVYLPFGVGVEIDGAAIGRLGYEVCAPPGVCTATTFMDDELLGKFKAGGASKLYIKDIRGRDSVFDLSLKGFTKAFEEL